MKRAKKSILKRLSEGVVLGDGGYIVELEQRGWVVTGAFTPEISMTHPGAVRELHEKMKNAGCEVLQVMAFYGSREKLETVGYGELTKEINRAATRIAREVAGDDLLVAGNLSTTWMWEPNDRRRAEVVAAMFDEQIKAQAGVDLVIGELFFKLGEALLCADRIKEKSGLTSMITMSFRAGNVTEDGFTAAECGPPSSRCRRRYRRLELHEGSRAHVPADQGNAPSLRRPFGGAARGLPHYRPYTPWFTGLPTFPDRLEPTQLTRFDLGRFADQARDMGVNYIGGCCGCKATHMRQMAKVLGKFEEKHHWNRKTGAMSETEYNSQSVGLG